MKHAILSGDGQMAVAAIPARRRSSGICATRASSMSAAMSGIKRQRNGSKPEYAAVRPEIDAIATEGVAKGADVAANLASEDNEEAPQTPEEWGDLTDSQVEEAEQHYTDSHIDQEKEYAVSNWQENGDPIYEAKHQLAEDDDFKSEWLSSYLETRDEVGDPRIPFNVDDLLGAIQIKPGDSYDDDPEITFDEKYLDKPDTLDTTTPTSPGIEPQKGAAFLTAKMREDITADLIGEFNEKAKSKAEDIAPPDYLDEEAKTSVTDAWDSLDDEEKFKYAQENVEGIDGAEIVSKVSTTALAWPAKFDPLNKTSGTDYKRTQALAKYIADKRGAQLITERTDAGIIGLHAGDEYPRTRGGGGWKPRSEFLGDDASYEKLYGPGDVGAKKDAAWTERMRGELQRADAKLWSGWKRSSTNAEGQLLQVAASDELGGRIRDAKPEKADPPEVIVAKGVMADMKATPEEHAAANKIISDAWSSGQLARSPKLVPELNSEKVGRFGEFIRLPDVKIDRNGAASTTVSPTVANGWNGTTTNAPQGINKKESIDYANKTYAAIGGYEGVKAALRAKWETTQYLLDKADIPVVQAYRGITYEHKLKGVTDTGEFNAPFSGVVNGYLVGHDDPSDTGDFHLATMKVGDQIKIASGKTITKVSDTGGTFSILDNKINFGKWEYAEPQTTKSRMVLRAEVPRTAVVSVPAYGVNVKSEQEVVVVGTAWRGWEAWSGQAPTFGQIPLHGAAKPPSEKEMKDTQALYDDLKKAQS